MERTLLLFFTVLFFACGSSAQNFKGQWKGSFVDRSTSHLGFGSDKCEYVLELDVNGKSVTGYSYTYFTDGGKKYYTICGLKGFVDRGKKYIEVKEYVRTKTNVPSNIRNCFQVHKLSYSKVDESEILEGKWIPAPEQEGDCGYGTTSLERRVLKKDVSLYNKQPVVKKSKPRTPPTVSPVAKAKPKTAAPGKSAKKDVVVTKPKKEDEEAPAQKTIPQPKIQEVDAPALTFEKRNNALLKTIEVENQTVKVDLYDNGEIDGDSISLFYNGKLLLSHKKLSEKPISLQIKVDKDKGQNELVMYAENLGTIPPNTALMVVMDGQKRYEVRIISDLQKSGAIRFALKPDVPGK